MFLLVTMNNSSLLPTAIVLIKQLPITVASSSCYINCMWQHQIFLTSIKKRFYESQFISETIKQLDEETSLLEEKTTINDN